MGPPTAIRVLRAARHLSRKDLSRLLGVSAARVSVIESGRLPLSPELRSRFAAALGASDRLFDCLADPARSLREMAPDARAAVEVELGRIILTGDRPSVDQPPARRMVNREREDEHPEDCT